jgi:mannose-6-phosphate isomerase-like protein (cupin superfamily)
VHKVEIRDPTTCAISTWRLDNGQRLSGAALRRYGSSIERPNGDQEPLAERLVFGEGTILLRATAKTTGGALTIFEEIPPLLDTPLHVHSKEDELFYILEGEHVVQRGETEFPVDTVFLPRGVPHAQRRVVPGEGRLLVVCSPAGFEDFFRDLAAAESEGRLGPDAYAAASAKAGLTWL